VRLSLHSNPSYLALFPLHRVTCTQETHLVDRYVCDREDQEANDIPEEESAGDESRSDVPRKVYTVIG